MYTQQRRDSEVKNRTDLELQIPATFFDPAVQDDGSINPTTKVLIAAKKYITALLDATDRTVGAESGQSPTTETDDKAGAAEEAPRETKAADDLTPPPKTPSTQPSPAPGVNVPRTTRNSFAPISAPIPAWVQMDPDIRRLRQTTTRLMQRIQGQAMQNGEVTQGTKELVNNVNDMLVDVLDNLE